MRGQNFAVFMFLMELGSQCNLAKTTFETLRGTAPAWYKDAAPESFATAMAPRDIMVNCAAFLSAAAIISKVLFEGDRKGAIARRCKSLRQFLGIEDLPTLRRLSVRNSFEHIDERYDKRFRSFDHGRVDPFRVSEKPPPPGTLVLKQFEPRRMVIAFAGDELSLEECMREVNDLADKIHAALKKLQTSSLDLWAV